MAITLNQLQPEPQQRVGRVVRKLVVIVAVVLTCVLSAHGTSTEKVLYAFQGVPDGSVPTSSLISDNAGNLYGTTSSGGTYGYGTVFKLSSTSGHWKETVLYSFSGASDGKYPYGGLVLDNAGNLYGTTLNGGLATCLCGAVFKLDPSGVESVILAFNDTDGERPAADLILDAQGNLFGTTSYGGAYGNGSVFELIPGSGGTWTEKVLYSFTSNSGDGSSPYGGLVFDKAGNLYGTTSSGGASGRYGVVFELKRSRNKWNESLLYQFTGGSDGGYPVAGLTFHGGKLYGTTEFGGIGVGVVFELQPVSGGWKETVLYTFQVHKDGNEPHAGLIFDKSGNAYGTTSRGGWRYCSSGCGAIFQLTPTSGGGWQETVLYRFNGRGVGDGEYPQGSRLLRDAKGQFYGTTSAGGGTGCNGIGCGVVFELFP
jgi:uncharacterized repeat protein (TIGR03803 family)